MNKVNECDNKCLLSLSKAITHKVPQKVLDSLFSDLLFGSENIHFLGPFDGSSSM